MLMTCSLTTQIKTLKSELGEQKEVVGNLSALSTASQVSVVTGGVSELVLLASLMWVLVAVVGVWGGEGGGVREGEVVDEVLLGDVMGIQQVVVVNLQSQAASKRRWKVPVESGEHLVSVLLVPFTVPLQRSVQLILCG